MTPLHLIMYPLAFLNGSMVTYLLAEGASPTIVEIIAGVATAVVTLLGGYAAFMKVKAEADKSRMLTKAEVDAKQAEIGMKKVELELKVQQMDDANEESIRNIMIKNLEGIKQLSSESLAQLANQVKTCNDRVEVLDLRVKELSCEVLDLKKLNLEERQTNYELKRHLIKVITVLEAYINTLPEPSKELLEVIEETNRIVTKNRRTLTEE